MKVGDKIRFLNAVGGGIVRGFQGKDIALVEDGDGFEIPVLIRECVVIDQAHEIQSKQPKPSAVIEAYEEEVVEEELEIVETEDGEELTIQLAFVPKDVKRLSSTNYDCYLINDSNYYLSFCLMTQLENGWEVKAIDTAEPNIKLHLFEVDKNELNDIEQTCVQFFAYKKDKLFDKKDACSIEMRIDPVKFYKLHSFKSNVYFDQPAIIVPVIAQDKPIKEIVLSAKEIKEAIHSKETPRVEKKVNAKAKKDETLVVDLHIHELIDNISGLSSADMLEYQIKTFNEVMTENKNNKGLKIVFIHGKGNGVLKNEISKTLKTKYKNVYSQDASFQEYGYGATMVTIK